MDIRKIAFGAVDTAYEHGVVSLFTHDQIEFSINLHEKMAHGKLISEAIRCAVSRCEEQGFLFGGIFCGLGPGSFVGIRIALATVLGFGFGKDLPLMGFCTHQALAFSVSPRTEALYFFMKASGHLGYLTAFTSSSDELTVKDPTKVISMMELVHAIDTGATVYTDQPEQLREVLGEQINIMNINGPTAEGIKRAALHRLNTVGSFIDESLFIKPNYIKPPSVSLPKKNLIIQCGDAIA